MEPPGKPGVIVPCPRCWCSRHKDLANWRPATAWTQTHHARAESPHAEHITSAANSPLLSPLETKFLSEGLINKVAQKNVRLQRYIWIVFDEMCWGLFVSALFKWSAQAYSKELLLKDEVVHRVWNLHGSDAVLQSPKWVELSGRKKSHVATVNESTRYCHTTRNKLLNPPFSSLSFFFFFFDKHYITCSEVTHTRARFVRRVLWSCLSFGCTVMWSRYSRLLSHRLNS